MSVLPSANKEKTRFPLELELPPPWELEELVRALLPPGMLTKQLSPLSSPEHQRTQGSNHSRVLRSRWPLPSNLLKRRQPHLLLAGTAPPPDVCEADPTREPP